MLSIGAYSAISRSHRGHIEITKTIGEGFSPNISYCPQGRLDNPINRFLALVLVNVLWLSLLIFIKSRRVLIPLKYGGGKLIRKDHPWTYWSYLIILIILLLFFSAALIIT